MFPIMSYVFFLRFKLSPLIQGNCKKQIKFCSTQTPCTEEQKERELERIRKEASIDELPTGCCQSGCSNCVFIVWAETLTKKMDNCGPDIANKILKMVDDPSMKAYLEMELRLRGLKK